MKIYRLHIVSLAFAFAAGVWAQSYRESKVSAHVVEPAASTATVQTEETDVAKEFPRLIDDSHVTALNGEKLPLQSSWAEDSSWDRASTIDSAEVEAVGDHDLLVSYGDALYRLNQNLDVVWEFRTAQFVIDFEVIESKNLIYLTAGDNLMAILNASSGEEIYGSGRNGSAAYGVAKQYGKDSCLITDNLWFYRDRARIAGLEPVPDRIACWRGTSELWMIDFPPAADLVVNGKRIIAVTKSLNGIYVKEVIPPASVDQK